MKDKARRVVRYLAVFAAGLSVGVLVIAVALEDARLATISGTAVVVFAIADVVETVYRVRRD